jgi:hypothetical protein
VLPGVPAAEPKDVLFDDRGASDAELRGEVARSSGLAAALDEYEHAPHDVPTVRRRRGRRDRIAHTVRDARRGDRDERLAA